VQYSTVQYSTVPSLPWTARRNAWRSSPWLLVCTNTSCHYGMRTF